MGGKEVKAIRLRLGLTQAGLAERVGVSRNTVTRWELGLMGVRESAAKLLQLLAKQPHRSRKE